MGQTYRKVKKTMDITKYKKALKSLRQETLAEIEAGKETTIPPELDQTTVGRLSRMDAIQNQQIALERERLRKQKLQRIDSALKRIDEDEYGYCARCEDDISEERLNFDPTIMVCKACMEE